MLTFLGNTVLTLSGRKPPNRTQRVRPAPGPHSETFLYTCSQHTGTKKIPKPVADPEEQRDRDYMDRYDCDGKIQLTVHSDQPNLARIVLIHMARHQPYCDIRLPPEVKAIIKDGIESSAKEVSPTCVIEITSIYIYLRAR